MEEKNVDSAPSVEPQAGPDFDNLTGMDFEGALNCAAKGLKVEVEEINAEAMALIAQGNNDQEYMEKRRRLNEKSMATGAMATFFSELTAHADFLDLKAAEESMGGLVTFGRAKLAELAVKGGWKDEIAQKTPGV